MNYNEFQPKPATLLKTIVKGIDYMDMKKNIMETLQEFCGKEELRDDDILVYDLGICDRELARMINILNLRFHITFLENPQDLQFASINDFINCARVNANG